MSEIGSTDASVTFVAGLILGAFMGFLAAILVTSYNDNYHETEYRKQMVELGVGSYDPRTGGFQVKACIK